MIPLRLRKRRDGSLCLMDAAGRVDGPDREFPNPHDFTTEWLFSNSTVAVIDGDTLTLTLANARAVYRITDRSGTVVTAELVSTELDDLPPALNEAAAEALDATLVAVDATKEA